MEIQKRKNFFIGLSLGISSNYDSGIAVLDENLNIVLLDKLYSNDDITTFFKNFNSLQSSVVAVSLPDDNSLLEGRWRIQAKNYRLLEDFKINANNWTNRINKRNCELFLDLKLEGCEIFRYFNFQLREAYGLNPHFRERTSLDCKNFQTSLKIKFDFDLPENMLPASNLEALLGAVFARDIYLGAMTQGANGAVAKKIAEFCELDVLQKIL